MKRLLDVSVLMALLWKRHENRKDVTAWLKKVDPVLCPISELGWLRISTSSAFGLSMSDARKLLSDFKRSATFIPCDISAMDGTPPPTSKKTTDFYFANLAEKHGMKWATLDRETGHKNVEVIPV